VQLWPQFKERRETNEKKLFPSVISSERIFGWLFGELDFIRCRFGVFF
jgi:hypothetical protein